MAPKMRKANKNFVTRSAVQSMIQSQIERKRIVQTSSGTVATSGALIYYSAMAQGDALNERSGQKILVKELAWTFAYSDAATGVARILLFQDTSNAGGAPSVTEVLSSATVQAHLNPTYHLQNRFRILVDRVFTTSLAGEQYVNIKGKVRVPLPVYFIGTTTNVASAGKNSIYALVIGGQATGSYVINVDMGYTDA